jgi:hypothetical protein
LKASEVIPFFYRTLKTLGEEIIDTFDELETPLTNLLEEYKDCTNVTQVVGDLFWRKFTVFFPFAVQESESFRSSNARGH